MKRILPPDAEHRALWAEVEAAVMERLGSAKFVVGTFSDRQTGGLRTHRWRKEFRVNWIAPGDHAELRTVGSDGVSRHSSWSRSPKKLLGLFTPVAERIKAGTYKPEPLRLVRIPKGNGKDRIIAVPSVTDRTLQAVILEALEPLLDPVLSDWQHGYRASSVGGEKVEVPGYRGVARGSTRIVALRLKRALGDGYHWLAEVDIKDAFSSVSRRLLVKLLMADGCSAKFAKFIVRTMGTTAVDGDGLDEAVVPVEGIPLGCVYAPLLFNFLVRQVHERIPSTRDGVRLVSYADNFFIATRDEDDLDEAVHDLRVALGDLGLGAEVKQRWSTDMNEPFFVLSGKKEGGFGLHLGDDGHVVLRGVAGLEGSVPPVPVLGGLGAPGVLVPGVPSLGIHQVGDLVEGRGLVPSVPSLPVLSVPAEVGVAVRPAATRGDHRPESSRYGVEEQEGGGDAKPAPARHHLDHARPAVVEAASAPDDNYPGKVDVVGGEAHAEITFPLSLDAVSAAVTGLEVLKKKPVTIRVSEEAVRQPHRGMVAVWSRLSKGLVGMGVKQVRLVLPLDGRLLIVPGLFGCPRSPGEVGDDHWRVEDGPTPDPKSSTMDVILARRGRLGEGRRRAVVRHSRCHVTVYPERVGSRFRGVVRGVFNHPSGMKDAIVHRGPKLPNPTAAIAEALADWLEGYDADVPVTVWLADGLVRSATRGHHLDERRNRYRGVRPPDMHRALLRLQRVVASTAPEVTFRRAERRGAMSREVIATAVAIEQVRALADELTVSRPTN